MNNSSPQLVCCQLQVGTNELAFHDCGSSKSAWEAVVVRCAGCDNIYLLIAIFLLDLAASALIPDRGLSSVYALGWPKASLHLRQSYKILPSLFLVIASAAASAFLSLHPHILCSHLPLQIQGAAGEGMVEVGKEIPLPPNCGLRQLLPGWDDPLSS